MKQPSLSRASEFNIERFRAAGNIFDSILMASDRAYQLRRGAEPKITDHRDPFNSGVMTALLETQHV